jgi:hypothetical protein
MAESARSIRIESETRPVEREEGGLHGEPYYNIVPLRQAYNVLRFGFTVAPLVAGIDKFFHLLVNWINI